MLFGLSEARRDARPLSGSNQTRKVEHLESIQIVIKCLNVAYNLRYTDTRVAHRLP